MFDEIFFPRTAEKHRAAPLAEPRARYLRHLKEVGTCRSTLRKCANDHLNLVRLLNPQDARHGPQPIEGGCNEARRRHSLRAVRREAGDH
jgi:hypothetical protein